MSVTHLSICKGNTVREIAERIDSNDITHAVIAYRDTDGDLHYHLVGEKDLTYLIGMMSRTLTNMHCLDSFDVLEDS